MQREKKELDVNTIQLPGGEIRERVALTELVERGSYHCSMMHRLFILIATQLLFDGVTCLATSPKATLPPNFDKFVIHAPKPNYPVRAQGEGIFVLRVNIKTGLVKEVIAARSTGNQILDGAAAIALRQWRFKPGALPYLKLTLPPQYPPLTKEETIVKVPINFTY